MHRAKKHFGQHFLHERGILERIVQAIDPRPGQQVVEIGPGRGALTVPLLDRLGALTVIEIDRDILPLLHEAARGHGQLQVIESDVLEVDFGALAAGRQLRLVGNLPYNISSPILFHALDHAAWILDMHFLLQKEVVDRMAAAPGGKVYGRLSVMLQARCEVQALLRVSPGAFSPPPKVDSALVRLIPKPADQIGIDDPRRFAQVVRAAFSQRRKTLRNALNELASPADLERVGIDPGVRAETLAVADYLRLANHLGTAD